jgi:outer membrane murein-binding lipoprotein Lpp
MHPSTTQSRLLLAAAAVLAVLVVPVAVASNGDAAKAGVQKKVKKLSKQVKALQKQVAALESEQGGGRPPSGPAGGGLTGSYPNPAIAAGAVGTDQLQDDSVNAAKVAANAVGTFELQNDSVNDAKILGGAVGNTEIANDAVDSTKIADAAVGKTEIADSAVGAPEIALRGVGADELGQFNDQVNSVSIPAGGDATVTASCPANTRIISGGASFPFQSGEIAASISDPSGNGWFAAGHNGGTVAQNLTVEAFCLTQGFSAP